MMKTEMPTFKEILSEHTHEGTLTKDLGNGKLECFSCGHRCVIGDGKEGICRVRFNRDGKLFVPWGYVGGVQLDPVEKKPFFHALPGSRALSFGMLGCDYHCSYCQNWVTSQALRDPEAISSIEFTDAENLVSLACERKAKIITSTYNEPLITSEWAVKIFSIAKRYGLVTSYVSNGNGTPEVLEFIRPYVDLYKVDLKGFNDRQYRKLGGVLRNVLETIQRLHTLKFWIEVVTLIVPGFNDSEEEIRDIADFLVAVSPDIPWHVTAFHSDYKMTEVDRTTAGTLLRAVEIGYGAGLHYVYAGNLPGQVGKFENTFCPSCHSTVIERRGFTVLQNILKNGACPKCATAIAGFWDMPVSRNLQ